MPKLKIISGPRSWLLPSMKCNGLSYGMFTWQKNGVPARILLLTCLSVTDAMQRSKWQCGMSSGGSQNICSAVPIVVMPQFGILYCNIPVVEHVTLSLIICIFFWTSSSLQCLYHAWFPHHLMPVWRHHLKSGRHKLIWSYIYWWPALELL